MNTPEKDPWEFRLLKAKDPSKLDDANESFVSAKILPAPTTVGSRPSSILAESAEYQPSREDEW